MTDIPCYMVLGLKIWHATESQGSGEVDFADPRTTLQYKRRHLKAKEAEIIGRLLV